MTLWLALSGCDLFESAIPEQPIDVEMLDHPSDAPAGTVDPWDVPISADSGTPFTSAPGSQDLGPLLFLDSLARQSGADSTYAVSFTDLVATGAPFVLNVSLGGGSVLAIDPPTSPPVSPPACAIAVDPQNLDPAAHAADVQACFDAWVDANGSPAEPTVTFAIGSRAATVEYSGTLHLEADENLEIGCEYDNQLPDEVVSNPDSYKIEDLRIGGYVGAIEYGMLGWGWVMVYESNDILQASVIGAFDLNAGSATYIGEEFSVSDPAAAGLSVAAEPVEPMYTPADDWNLAVYQAMLGTGGNPGAADACWGSLHDDVPNPTIVSWSLLGSAKPQL